jgi:hypothetical protein
MLIELDGEMKCNFHICNPDTQGIEVRIVSRGKMLSIKSLAKQ